MIVDKFQQGPLSNELLGETNQLQQETMGVLKQRGVQLHKWDARSPKIKWDEWLVGPAVAGTDARWDRWISGSIRSRVLTFNYRCEVASRLKHKSMLLNAYFGSDMETKGSNLSSSFSLCSIHPIIQNQTIMNECEHIKPPRPAQRPHTYRLHKLPGQAYKTIQNPPAEISILSSAACWTLDSILTAPTLYA